ncbi:hypothetical protein PMAYCL1PPCAC_13748 [Pristionchus mayeri]|uniref:Uncharacterized protein n=1 Tax=Pristionchus mayeri TaxID=1317129 RepID=A0AAN4ZLR5_9BILA|nr:hypothetical protein PMAYCL1PPCAC_13748 [Pristionchus mayeri]
MSASISSRSFETSMKAMRKRPRDCPNECRSGKAHPSPERFGVPGLSFIAPSTELLVVTWVSLVSHNLQTSARTWRSCS